MLVCWFEVFVAAPSMADEEGWGSPARPPEGGLAGGGALDRAVVPVRIGGVGSGLVVRDAHGECAVQRQQAAVDGYGEGLYSRRSGNRANRCGCGQCRW